MERMFDATYRSTASRLSTPTPTVAISAPEPVKKPRKRKADDLAGGEASTEKRTSRRKGKAKDADEDEDTLAVEAALAEEPAKKRNKKSNKDAPAQDDSATVSAAETEPKQRKKKDKGKDIAIAPEPIPIHSGQLDIGLSAASADEQSANAQWANDFLAAVMSALNDPSTQPDPTHYPPAPGPSTPLQPAASTSYAPYAPDAAFQDPQAQLFTELVQNLQALSDTGDLHDPTKVTDMLRSLGVPNQSAAPNFTLADGPGAGPELTQRQQLALEAALAPTPLGQVPLSSELLRGLRAGVLQIQQGQAQVGGRHTQAAHAEMLATKWMKSSELAQLEKTHGLVYKKGKFSAIEDEQLRVAKESYRLRNGLAQHQLETVIFSKEKRDVVFWQELTRAVPQRPMSAVYHHVRRMEHPLKKMGKWMPEEDARLAQAVALHGPQWETVSSLVGRMASDCRDRWRNHLNEKDKRNMGPWSKDEEDELQQIVTELSAQEGRDIKEADGDIFWGKVSERMGYKRNRQQCKGKWTDVMSKTIKSSDGTARWSHDDAWMLIQKVGSLNVRHDTEIDWKTLPDANWNVWSAHTLQRRWLTMKRSIKGWEQMSHAEIMDILREKKGHHPSSTKKPGERRSRITSAAIVGDDDDDDSTTGGAEGSVADGGAAGEQAQGGSAAPVVAKTKKATKKTKKGKARAVSPPLVVKDYRTAAPVGPA